MLPVWSSFGFDDKARLNTAAVLVAATVWIYAGTFVVGCKAFVVTLVHRVLKVMLPGGPRWEYEGR